MGEIDIDIPEPSPEPDPRPQASTRVTDTGRPPAEPSTDDDLEFDISTFSDATRAGSKRAFSAVDTEDEEPADHSLLVKSLTTRHNLDASSGLELERFSKLRLQEQLIMLEATVLALKQAMAAQTSATAWAIPAELESNITNYTSAFAFSANCRAYKKFAPETVLAAMRAGKVALPADSDIGRLDKVVKRISDRLTDYRAELKRKIKDSIAAKTDIATLAAIVVHGVAVKLTVEFYHRLAWLRHYGPQLDFESKFFWNNVDNLLEKVRGKFPGDNYTLHFKSIYRKDTDKFGSDAANIANIALVQFSALPEHQRIVENTATNTTNTARKRACVVRQAVPRASSSASTPSAD
ncbi:hypothetical protein AURDEDRAFT_159650 [Auricularia subglabra TFB-10046 SS5]|nr:hypothetical protein AURDEDRAFT_159650 [Auricularia subglabra TFB-10046 SS5]